MTILDVILENRGITKEQLIPFKQPDFSLPTMKKAIDDLFPQFFVFQKDKIGILYDVDVDGLFAGYILNDFLTRLSKQVLCFINKQKQHGITEDVIQWVRDNQIEWLFVVDAGSNDTQQFQVLSNMRVKVVVLDHHAYEIQPSYPPNVWIINPYHYEKLPRISGAGVVYRFVESVSKLLGINVAQYEPLVGVTVLSDMCSMLDRENRYYVDRLFHNISNTLLFNQFKFWGSKQSLFTYQIIPFLNALIRIGQEREALDIVNNLNRSVKMKRIPNMIEPVKKRQEALIQELLEIGVIKEKDHVVLHLRKGHEHLNTINGLVANQLLAQYKKAALVLRYDETTKEWKGSFRGKSITKSDLIRFGIQGMGHEGACGVISTHENLSNFSNNIQPSIETVQRLSDYAISSGDIRPNDWLEIAKFNEMTGVDLPPITVNYRQGIRAIEESVKDTKKVILKTAHEEIIDFEDRDSDSLVVLPSLSLHGYQLIRQY